MTAKCRFPLSGLRVLPELPETGHAEGFLPGECEFVFRFLLTLRRLFPLEDRIRRNDDADGNSGPTSSGVTNNHAEPANLVVIDDLGIDADYRKPADDVVFNPVEPELVLE